MTQNVFSKQALTDILKQPLPGMAAHKGMWVEDETSRFEAHNMVDRAKRSAVTLLLYPVQDDMHFLLMQRVSSKGVHSGQISLPGGKQEPSENLLQTAMRELQEETNIHLESEDYIGRLSPLYVPPSNFLIYPYVAYLPQKPQWEANPQEVDMLFSASLHTFLQPDTCTSFVAKAYVHKQLVEAEVPAFCLNNKMVWGATAMILNEFKVIINADIRI